MRRHLPESQMSRGGLLSYLSRDLPNRRVSCSGDFNIRRNGGRGPERPISRNTEKANQKSPNGRFLATTAPREVFCSRHRCPQWSFFEVADGILRRRYGTRLGETSVRVPAGDHCCGRRHQAAGPGFIIMSKCSVRRSWNTFRMLSELAAKLPAWLDRKSLSALLIGRTPGSPHHLPEMWETEIHHRRM